jgi:hypothetical protein
MGIVGGKTVFHDEIAELHDCGLRPPPCLTGGGGRDLQKPAFNTYYGARGIKYQYIYIYIAFIFQGSIC